MFVGFGSYSPAPSFVQVPSNSHFSTYRIALGYAHPRCARDGRPPVQIRAGGTIYGSTIEASGHEGGVAGLGVEIELNARLPMRSRIGGRIGVETEGTGGWIYHLGPRYRFAETVWMGVDLFHLPKSRASPSCDEIAIRGCSTTTTGVVIGIGGAGRYGAYAAIALMVGALAWSAVPK